MRTARSLLIFALCCLIMGCKQSENPIMAKAFHHNLYFSEVMDEIPYFESKEDSLIFMEQYVNEWILRQTLLALAKQKLTQKEQNFSSQVQQYNEQLLMEAFLQKISRDSLLFTVPLNEIELHCETPSEYREMVKLNYIKLSNPSKLYKKIKELFFAENDRMKAIAQMELLCADTIEYYLDDEHWFFTDILEKEFPFSLSNERGVENKEKLDFLQDKNRYLVLILDRKQQLQPKNSLDDKKILQSLLQQQKKIEFIKNYQDSLVKKALLEKKAIKYPVVY